MNLKIYEKTGYNNIYKHRLNGTYAIDLSLGYDEYGKRIRTTKTGFKSEKEARSFLRSEDKRKKIKESFTCTSNFEDGLEEYYDYCLKQLRLKKTSVKNKKGRFNKNMIPFFKGKKINKIIDKDIVAWHEYLDSKKLCVVSKNTLHKQLSAYFNYLVNYKKIITLNPCITVKNYKIPKQEIVYYSIDEINLIFDTINNDQTKSIQTKLLITAILKLFFFGGFRVGELMGFKFKDIELDIINNDITVEKEIVFTINQTVYYTTGGWIESDGKTDASLDRCFIGKNAVEYLIKYIRYMQSIGVVYDYNDFIFTNPDTGKIYSQENIRKHFNYYINKANLRKIKLKDLRHSCGTFLLSLGYKLEDVKDKLRHTSIKTTEKYYATFYEQVKRNTANDIDKYA